MKRTKIQTNIRHGEAAAERPAALAPTQPTVLVKQHFVQKEAWIVKKYAKHQNLRLFVAL
jgi:hypothetical protein